jgi:hypothetical protein
MEMYQEPSHKDRMDHHIDEAVQHAALEHPQTKKLMKTIKADMLKASKAPKAKKK